MAHIIVPTSTRTSGATRAERRRREEEEQERRRVRMMPSSAPAPFPARQDSRNISTWEETIGSGPLRQEQPDAKYLGWKGIGSELMRPALEAEKQTFGRVQPLIYAAAPYYDYDAPSWDKKSLGGFKFTEDPLDEVSKTSWDRFKRVGRGLTDEQQAEIPIGEQLVVEGLTDYLTTGPILGGAKLLGKIPGAIKKVQKIQDIREAQRAKTLMSMPGQPKATVPDLQRFAGTQLGKVTPEQMVRPTTLEGNQALSQLADQQALNYLQSPEQIRFASGLSGIDTVGGALDSKGIRVVDQAEWDAAKVAARNETFGTNFSPKDFTSEEAFQALKASKPQHWHVSPVCINLSAAKVGRNLDPNDIAIGRSVVRVINEISPPSISLENVPAYTKTGLYDDITKALDEAGYTWDTNIVEAADYGAAQSRVRLILRAVRKDVGELPPLPQKTHNFSGTGQGEDWYSLLEDLIDGEVKVPLSQLLAGPNSPVDEINRIKGTFGRKVGDRLRLEPNRPIITMGASASKGLPNARNAGGPAPTLLAGHGVPRIIIPGAKGLDDATVVRVTPEMMKRLMGLPENFRAPTRPSIAKVTLGNGVHGAVTRDFIQPLVNVHRATPSVRSMTDAFSAARVAPTAPVRAIPPTAPVRAAADVPTAPATIPEPGGIQPSLFDEPRGSFAPEENVFMPDDIPSKRRLTDAEDMVQEQRISEIESGALREQMSEPPIVRTQAAKSLPDAIDDLPQDGDINKVFDDFDADDFDGFDGGGTSGQGFGSSGNDIVPLSVLKPHLTQTQRNMNLVRQGLIHIQNWGKKQPFVQKASEKISSSTAKSEKAKKISNALQERLPQIGVLDDPVSQAAVTEINRTTPIIEAIADRAAFQGEDIIQLLGGLGPDLQRESDGVYSVIRLGGRITAGMDSTLINAKNGEFLSPTITDMAARLPIYESYLTPEQLTAFHKLEDTLAQLRSQLNKVSNEKLNIIRQRDLYVAEQLGRKVNEATWEDVFYENPLRLGTRSDVEKGGGFYAPRGNAFEEGAETAHLRIPRTDGSIGPIDDLPTKRTKGGTGDRPLRVERHLATFDSQAEGIAAGYEYAPFTLAIRSHVLKAGTQILDTHVQNFYKTRLADDGKYLGRSPKMRMLGDPGRKVIIKQMEALNKRYRNLKLKVTDVSSKERAIINGFLHGDYGNDMDEFTDFADALQSIKTKRGKHKGKGVPQLINELDELIKEVSLFKPKYKKALDASTVVLETRKITGGRAIGLQLDNLDFPEAIAQSTTKALVDQTGIPGVEAVRIYNGLYRGTNATLDNSALGIQGLIGLSNDLLDPAVWKSIRAGKPIEGPYAEALGVNLESWKNPDIMRSFLNTFDERAVENGALSSMEWARHGIKGTASEMTEAFAIRQSSQAGVTEKILGGVATGVGKIGAVKAANRAFGNFGYSLRLGWANKSLMDEVRRSGMSIDELIADGTVAELAKVINNMTGHSGRRFGGTVGELVMFAPKFLQARLETLGKGSLGALQTIPGASKIGIEGIGHVGRLRPAQREARNSLIRLIGAGTSLTYAANSLRGYPTDFNPYHRDKNGKLGFNPNFMRIRNVYGRDWSLFGTYDSLLRAIVSSADPRIGKAIPGADLLFIAPSGVASLLGILKGEESFPYLHKMNAWDTAKALLTEHVPFSYEEVPSIIKQSWGTPDDMIRESSAVIAGEMVGSKSSPLSKADRKEFGISDEETPIKPSSRYPTSGGLRTGSGRRQLSDSGRRKLSSR